MVLTKPWSIFEHLRQEEDCTRTHVSLFSGCGGMDLGLRQAGFKTVFANDFDYDACSTYQTNLGEIEKGDIRTVTIPRFKKRIDLVSAGFPCQPFSNAGLRKGIEDKRGTLYQSALDVVQTLEPKAVIFENVRGILSFKSGKKMLVEEICENLDSLGYDVAFSLIDSSKHHVPQKRLRVFIVGISKEKKYGKFSFPSATHREDLTLKHTIFDISKDTKNQNELLKLNPQAIYLGSMVPEGGSWKNIPYDKLPARLKKIADNMQKYRWPNFYRRFHRDEISGTITAAFKPENAGVWHPLENRVLSVREIARIQSFPDWFFFEGRNIKSKYKQIGNAVPPRLAFELGLNIDAALNGKNLRQDHNYIPFDQFIQSGKPLKAKDKNVIFIRSNSIQQKLFP